MNWAKLVIVDFPGGLLGWGPLMLMTGLSIYATGFMLRAICKQKVCDPEWRRCADGWSWLAVAIGTMMMVLFSGFFLLIMGTNIVWYFPR